MNEENPERISSAGGCGMGVMISVLLYVLSPGPVFMAFEKLGANNLGPIDNVIGMLYFPIGWGMEHVPGVRQFYIAYMKLFGIDIG